MLTSFFSEFLILSEKLRKGYIDSLSKGKKDWEKYIPFISQDIPKLYEIIYSKVEGTKREIQDQTLMDFVPGYRLIHITEMEREKQTLDAVLKNYNTNEVTTILPLLANYSSDFICYFKMVDGKECIGNIMHDDVEFYLMHESVENFFITICEFYKKEVYFIDQDGFLDYDLDKESEVGKLLNKGVMYWDI